MLKLGTEIVTDQQKTVAALLGASPGASTAAPIAINVMQKLFPEQFKSLRNGRKKSVKLFLLTVRN